MRGTSMRPMGFCAWDQCDSFMNACITLTYLEVFFFLYPWERCRIHGEARSTSVIQQEADLMRSRWRWCFFTQRDVHGKEDAACAVSMIYFPGFKGKWVNLGLLGEVWASRTPYYLLPRAHNVYNVSFFTENTWFWDFASGFEKPKIFTRWLSGFYRDGNLFDVDGDDGGMELLG